MTARHDALPATGSTLQQPPAVPDTAVPDILAHLMNVPPVQRWVDIGSGGRSLLWSCGLRASELVVVDSDAEALDTLHRTAAGTTPDPAHTEALRLSGRHHPNAFARRCAALTGLIRADCLDTDLPTDPPLKPATFDLVTQFGLLDHTTLARAFTRLHTLLTPGGWTAGATTAPPQSRPRDIAARHRRAATDTGIQLLLLSRISSARTDTPEVWAYVGRST